MAKKKKIFVVKSRLSVIIAFKIFLNVGTFIKVKYTWTKSSQRTAAVVSSVPALIFHITSTKQTPPAESVSCHLAACLIYSRCSPVQCSLQNHVP